VVGAVWAGAANWGAVRGLGAARSGRAVLPGHVVHDRGARQVDVLGEAVHRIHLRRGLSRACARRGRREGGGAAAAATRREEDPGDTNAQPTPDLSLHRATMLLRSRTKSEGFPFDRVKRLALAVGIPIAVLRRPARSILSRAPADAGIAKLRCGRGARDRTVPLTSSPSRRGLSRRSRCRRRRSSRSCSRRSCDRKLRAAPTARPR
jgi:hypothetical protein